MACKPMDKVLMEMRAVLAENTGTFEHRLTKVQEIAYTGAKGTLPSQANPYVVPVLPEGPLMTSGDYAERVREVTDALHRLMELVAREEVRADLHVVAKFINCCIYQVDSSALVYGLVAAIGTAHPEMNVQSIEYQKSGEIAAAHLPFLEAVFVEDFLSNIHPDVATSVKHVLTRLSHHKK